MALQSQLFRGDLKLEAAAVSDPARIIRQVTRGAPSRPGHLEILADAPGQMLVDLVVPRNGRHFSSSPVDENSVGATFAQQLTAVPFEMANEVAPLHQTGAVTRSLITVWPWMDSSASARFASSTS